MSPSPNSPTAARKPSAAVRAMTGPTKAAITFLCLGEQAGSDLMKRLSTTEIERITHAMSRLGPIPAEIVEDVLSEFTESVITGTGSVTGSLSAAEALLRKFMPEEEVTELLNTVRGNNRQSATWRRFASLDESVIANYLEGEHDQTAAAILNNIDTSVAAKVLPLLGTDRMYDVAERMVGMEAVPIHMMRQIEETLKKDIMSDTVHTSAAETHQRMADMFNKLDVQAFEQLSQTLDQRIPETFQAIKQRMFVFDDLVRLSTQDLAQVMRGLEGDTLPLAMRGAKKELRDYLMSCLPQRSRQMLMDEMEATGPVRGRDVNAAQTTMVDYAKVLADQGLIQLPSHTDEEDEIFE
ncbi:MULTISPECIES: flagellar motor switch protein FliG [unclassified Sulfitobacter]|nr:MULTISPECIES: flagellar motor switch protein FliG [unclassified Sulfitobacter]KZY02531.1 flagellar motor protein [Sulfitobacter sp. HI0023]KZY24044.1 flagellar motor protein [Sulfitobacter sp. HI0040]KZZ68135.1 flagellar motor protein [Sulfitobacter sp. HI0129]